MTSETTETTMDALEKLRALSDAATLGPWAAPDPPDGPGEGMVWGGDGITICDMYWSTEEKRRLTALWKTPLTRPDDSHIANTEFIVAAVNYVRAALAERLRDHVT